MAVAGVIFDMDGVIIDSEQLWDRAREEFTRQHGGTWRGDAQRAMMGMASHEWSAYMHDELKVQMAPQEISAAVVARLEELYREQLPLIDGATDAVHAAAARWPVAIASSSNRELIDLITGLAGIGDALSATVSSEEAGRGKPAPDVFLRAAELLQVAPEECVVIEDSANGIRAGAASGAAVIAIPNPHFPPPEDALDEATLVIDRVAELTDAVIERAGSVEQA